MNLRRILITFLHGNSPRTISPRQNGDEVAGSCCAAMQRGGEEGVLGQPDTQEGPLRLWDVGKVRCLTPHASTPRERKKEDVARGREYSGQTVFLYSEKLRRHSFPRTQCLYLNSFPTPSLLWAALLMYKAIYATLPYTVAMVIAGVS